MSYQQDQEAARRLITDAGEEGFIQEWNYSTRSRGLRKYRSMPLDYRHRVIRRYGFSERFAQALLRETFSTWEELLAVISRIMERLYRQQDKQDALGDFQFTLSNREFSSHFIKTFERLASRKMRGQEDLLLFHFSKDLSLYELAYFEELINTYFRSSILALKDVKEDERRLVEERERIVSIKTLTHPGSVELLIVGGFVIATTVLIPIGNVLIRKMMKNRRRNPSLEEINIIIARLPPTQGEPSLTRIESSDLEDITYTDDMSDDDASNGKKIDSFITEATNSNGDSIITRTPDLIAGAEKP